MREPINITWMFTNAVHLPIFCKFLAFRLEAVDYGSHSRIGRLRRLESKRFHKTARHRTPIVEQAAIACD